MGDPLTRSARLYLLAVTGTLLFLGLGGAAMAGPTFSTSASTGVKDMCNLAGVGGIQTGDASAIAPEGRLIENCNGSNINSDATASAGLAQGNVSISGGAFLLGSLHTSASASGPSQADGRAIFFELLTVLPTADFGNFAFNVVATYTVDGDISDHAQAAAELQTTSALSSIDQSSAVCTYNCGLTPVANGHYLFSIVETIPVLTSSPFLSVQTTLDTFAGSTTFPFTDQPGAADFSNTGSLALTLPDGFTFVSDVNQGVLTPPPGSAPEPGRSACCSRPQAASVSCAATAAGAEAAPLARESSSRYCPKRRLIRLRVRSRPRSASAASIAGVCCGPVTRVRTAIITSGDLSLCLVAVDSLPVKPRGTQADLASWSEGAIGFAADNFNHFHLRGQPFPLGDGAIVMQLAVRP